MLKSPFSESPATFGTRYVTFRIGLGFFCTRHVESAVHVMSMPVETGGGGIAAVGDCVADCVAVDVDGGVGVEVDGSGSTVFEQARTSSGASRSAGFIPLR
jgi:hypothetical protein